MNEISLDNHSDICKQTESHVKLSTKDEIDDLASDLANSYIEYFAIDIGEQKQRSDEAIDECLTHLEEVGSVLESYRLNNGNKSEKFMEQLASKNESLNRLYEQVDGLEQYMFETKQLLNQLENAVKELEIMKKSSGNAIRQIIDMIPRFSLINVPRLGILESFNGYMEEAYPNSPTDNEFNRASIEEILSRVSEIQASLAIVTSKVLLL